MIKNKSKTNTLSTKKLTTIGLLSGISILLSVTPLGYIPILPINMTIMHVPVIIAAIIEGPMSGAIVGGIFGLTSLIRAFTVPTPTNFIFWNPIISIGVRVFMGWITGVLFNKIKNFKYSVTVSSIIGSLTNTIGVLGLTYIFYLAKYANALGISEKLAGKGILTVALINGVPEAILSAFISIAIVSTYNKVYKKNNH